ncbi:uroporphyrinogen-III C-methyltransferase [Ideonella azotifigens]|uniref:uroporphyrinogen-III C-methyltransferase n=2 Tax=Ideonella azotifigens TaxID=513160 RepID=A0ABN1JTE3_9BURK|nr:uroporphyrinogen-III C-methyltransferase [Ideonella azotifigens]MCD2340915.1 uroporphyrinogen-III C-methyltransferase [Ideonella azotifigens]
MSLPANPATPGRVIFIGAGPGSADLITLRGARALGQAQVVLFDALTDPSLRDFAPQALWLDVGKRGFTAATAQARINALLVQHAASGAVVARLKGGDPSIFGRLEEELQALAEAGIASEVIPGVTAALAAAAATQRPLTRRGQGRSLALSTAMTAELELRASQRADTEVFYMAGRQLADLSRRLQDAGWAGDTPVNVVSRAGWPDQLMSDHCVSTLPAACVMHAGRPAVVTVGVGAAPVCRLLAAPTATAVEGHPASAAFPP